MTVNQVSISFLFLLVSAWVLLVDGWKSSGISKRREQVNQYENSLDYLLNNDKELDAIKKNPASTRSEKLTIQQSYPISSCEKDKTNKRKAFWKKAKASVILGTIRSALISFRSAISSFASVSDTTTTTEPTTTSTTTTTTTMMTTTCSTTTTTTGTFKSIRNPGHHVEQCLSITVPAGEKIQFTCTSVYDATSGTYAMFYDQSGTNLIANPPTVNMVYTTSDNTLLIKSLASRANQGQLGCEWTTVVAFKNVFIKKPNGPFLLKG